jgi:hypothetical protein
MKEATHEDTGKHYRFEYDGLKLDPYRIFDVYNVTDAKAQHAIKKLLRMEGKGHTEKEVWLEVLDIVTRALEMIQEDENLKPVDVHGDLIVDTPELTGTLLQEDITKPYKKEF